MKGKKMYSDRTKEKQSEGHGRGRHSAAHIKSAAQDDGWLCFSAFLIAMRLLHVTLAFALTLWLPSSMLALNPQLSGETIPLRASLVFMLQESLAANCMECLSSWVC